VREEKRDLMMLKAQGAPDELIKAQQDRVRSASADVQDFCDSTGRARHRDREGVYTERKFPAADTYDVTTFERTQKEMIEGFYSVGGAQVEFNNVSGMVPNVPLNPVPRPATVPQTPAGGMKYGKPFDDSGYRRAQREQIANAKATLDAAPAEAKGVWDKVADDLKRPLNDASDGAYYSPAEKRTHYESWKKCFEESTYQRKNSVFFHEYGHNIDHLLGGGGRGNNSYYSMQYVGKNGKTFAQVLEKEISDTLKANYLDKKGYSDAFDAVKAAQNGKGGMGFNAYVKQALRQTVSNDEYWTLLDMMQDSEYADDVMRQVVETHLQPLFEQELRTMVRMDKGVAKEFCNWVKSEYNIYETTDVSDAFGNYMTRTYGKDFSHPFGVGHAASYQMDATNLPIESFAEFYSATVTQSDALTGIKKFLPESYDFFLEMLGAAL
jgi:hypothetical protein